MKAPNKKNPLNYNERWLRSSLLDLRDGKYGSCSESMADMVVDFMISIKSRRDLGKGSDVGENGGIVTMLKVIDAPLIVRIQDHVNGKESEEKMEYDIIVTDAK